jgi:hypothetical protein
MTGPLYELIGRVVVRFVRARYRHQIRIAIGVAVAAIAAGGYVAATRQPPEG